MGERAEQCPLLAENKERFRWSLRLNRKTMDSSEKGTTIELTGINHRLSGKADRRDPCIWSQRRIKNIQTEASRSLKASQMQGGCSMCLTHSTPFYDIPAESAVQYWGNNSEHR